MYVYIYDIERDLGACMYECLRRKRLICLSFQLKYKLLISSDAALTERSQLVMNALFVSCA